MSNMTIIFPVAEATLREAWVEHGELVPPTVTIVVPVGDVPKEIRRKWCASTVNLTSGHRRDGDLVVYGQKWLGGGIRAPAVVKRDATPEELLAGLVDAIAEVDRSENFDVETRVTEWFEGERPESFDSPTDRAIWLGPPNGYKKSTRASEVEAEVKTREEYYQAWVEEQRKVAREVAIDAECEEMRIEALAKQSRVLWEEWAINRGSEDLQAAIEGGYPIGDRIEREVAELLPQEVAGCEVFVSGYETKGDRPVPNATARHVRAKLVEEMNRLRGYLPPCTVDVSRVKRVVLTIFWCSQCERACDKCGCSPSVEKCTGVSIEIQAPHLNKPIARMYVIEEPLPNDS